jgi:hypothetical protein
MGQDRQPTTLLTFWRWHDTGTLCGKPILAKLPHRIPTLSQYYEWTFAGVILVIEEREETKSTTLAE